MTDTVATSLEALERRLQDLGQVAVAVSGGVDSMTLAVVVGRMPGSAGLMFHGVSPAVPPEATARVRRYAAREGWRVQLLDAGEFADTAYLDNPVDRCFYCKTNLYRSIAQRTQATIVSGANRDDLDDYRPGLRAADDYGVRHPLLEAGIDKATVRAIARRLGLTDLAELPASPCLSSRVETGIPIRPAALTLIHRVEQIVSREIQPRAVRCRLRHAGVAIELDRDSLAALSADHRNWLAGVIEPWCRQAGLLPFLGFEPYRVGSAFLRDAGHG